MRRLFLKAVAFFSFAWLLPKPATAEKPKKLPRNKPKKRRWFRSSRVSAEITECVMCKCTQDAANARFCRVCGTKLVRPKSRLLSPAEKEQKNRDLDKELERIRRSSIGSYEE